MATLSGHQSNVPSLRIAQSIDRPARDGGKALSKAVTVSEVREVAGATISSTTAYCPCENASARSRRTFAMLLSDDMGIPSSGMTS